MKHIALATVIAFTLAFVGGPLVHPVEAQGQGNSQGITIPVLGSGSGATFVGAFNLQRFSVVNGVVSAVGTLTGTVTNAAGQVTSIVRTLTIPLDLGATQATCDILHLDLGPLNLNLLGLNIDLSRIILDITAEPGAGNLLGNLLCAVAGLLDNPSGLANILNRILSILG
jgi:hypothetical protein